jgi:hypothetical protein
VVARFVGRCLPPLLLDVGSLGGCFATVARSFA